MPIDPISALAQAQAAQNPQVIGSVGSLGDEARISFNDQPQATKPTSFEDQLASAVQDLNATQMAANAQSQALATGQATDVAQVVIAVERAQLEMQLATTIRNKLVDAFNELQRVQI